MSVYPRIVMAMVLVFTWTALPAGSAAPDDYPMEPRAVAEGVYAVMTPARDFPNPENLGWNANLAFVVTGDGVLVIDTGSSETIGMALRQTIAEVTDQPVRWIVNTHSHGDHWLGNHAFAEDDPEIIAGSAAKERMAAETDHWISLFDEMTEGATGEFPVLLPNRTVDERTVETLGDTEVVFLPSGGSHSPGDVAVWLPETRVLIAGDTVYTGRAPSVWDGSVERWLEFLGELQALEPEVVIPGHGHLEGPETLVRLERYLLILWDAIAQAVEAGKPDFEAVPLVRERMGDLIEAYPGFEDKIDRSVAHTYPEVEQAIF